MLSGALNAMGAGLMMSEPGSAASSADLHDDCSRASRSSSGDDLNDENTHNNNTTASAIYQPPLGSIDYCNSLSTSRRDYCSRANDSVDVFQSTSNHASSTPEVGLSYACAVSGWPSHFRSPQFASLMVAAAAGAMLPNDTHTASSSLAM